MPRCPANPGAAIDTDALEARREAAVQAAAEHMAQLRSTRADWLRSPLEEQRQLSGWKRKVLEQLDTQQAKWTPEAACSAPIKSAGSPRSATTSKPASTPASTHPSSPGLVVLPRLC